MSGPLLGVPKSLPAPAAEPFDGADAKMIVFQFFQGAVNEGWAEWKINTAGQTEVHVQSGEVFLLQKDTVTRLK
jgi:hypothetical protein